MPGPFVGIDSVNTFPQQTRKQQWYRDRETVFCDPRRGHCYQRRCKHISAAANRNTAIEELCFMCGPCRDVISKGQVVSLALYGSL
jgi:hypothetical protein